MHVRGRWSARAVMAVAAAAVALSPATVVAGDPSPRLDDGADAPLRVDRLSAVLATPVAPPRAVRAADHRRHLVYELLVTNPNSIALAVRQVDVLDQRSREVLARVSGDELTSAMGTVSGRPGTRLGPAQVGFLALDVRLHRGQQPPKALAHQLTVQPLPQGSGPEVRIDAATAPVDERGPLVVAPPLQGRRWLDLGGCCGPGAHRMALLPVNGGLHLAQRYAVDIVRMSPGRRVLTGPLDELSSYPGYGEPVRSATSGTVVEVVDRHPDQVPFDPDPVGIADAGGNHVAVATGDGRFVWYAHLAPGSVRVAVGDVVRVGETLARLGNSGNTDLPHLHFQVTDGPALLGSEGEPWVLRRYRSPGSTPPIETLAIEEPLPVRPRWDGPYRLTLPLERQVLTFR